jgi:hydrogenase maturation protease
MEKTNYLVLGMGNPLLCDDGIGLRIVECAEKKIDPDVMSVTFTKNYSGGFDMIYDLMGFHKVIIVDSVVTGRVPFGFCHEFALSDIERTEQDRLVYAHGISLPTVLRIGEQCGYPMPAEIIIYGIESDDVCSFSTMATPPLENAVGGVVDKIGRQLSVWEKKSRTTAKAGNKSASIQPKFAKTKEFA